MCTGPRLGLGVKTTRHHPSLPKNTTGVAWLQAVCMMRSSPPTHTNPGGHKLKKSTAMWTVMTTMVPARSLILCFASSHLFSSSIPDRVCMCVCVRACVFACVCVCVCACRDSVSNFLLHVMCRAPKHCNGLNTNS